MAQNAKCSDAIYNRGKEHVKDFMYRYSQSTKNTTEK